MLKRIFAGMFALLMTAVSANAAVLTDAPGTPTQDRAVSLEAQWLDEERTAYDLEALPSDQLTMDETVDVYEFVFEQQHRPVRWYPEETQRAIEEMVGIDPDALYMTEFMRLHAAACEPKDDLEATMTLTIDYQPGQLIVVVLADTTDPLDLVWTPVESRVIDVGVVEFIIPVELMEQLQNEDVLFNLLTVRHGSGGKAAAEETEAPVVVPSRSGGDKYRIVNTVREDGEALPDDFTLEVAPITNVIVRELDLLDEHVREQEKPAVTWLPYEDQNRIRFLMNPYELEIEEMIVTDYVPLITRDFRPTDGDAVGTLSFLTPYQEDQQIVTALGIPKESDVNDGETLMDWSVQPVTVRRGGIVDIVFDQLALIDMGEETGLLLMFAEQIEQDEQAEQIEE